MIDHLDGFFNDFAIFATVAGSPVRGFFDMPYSEGIAGLVAGASMSLMCKAADVPGADRGDAVAIGATNYTVAGVEPDGHGLVKLLLMKA